MFVGKGTPKIKEPRRGSIDLRICTSHTLVFTQPLKDKVIKLSRVCRTLRGGDEFNVVVTLIFF